MAAAAVAGSLHLSEKFSFGLWEEEGGGHKIEQNLQEMFGLGFHRTKFFLSWSQ